MKETDLRIIKTRRNMEQAMLYLLREKSFDKITVQDILDKALINRSTFYKHCADKYALLHAVSDVCYARICADVDRRFSEPKSELSSIILHLYASLQMQREDTLALLRLHTPEFHLYDDLAAYLKTHFSANYKAQITDKACLDYLSTLYAELVLCSLEWCLQNGNTAPLENLLPQFSQLTVQMVHAAGSGKHINGK